MKTIIEICKEAADLAAVRRPEDLFNSSSQQDSIFLSLAKSTLDSLLRYGDWQNLVKDGWIYVQPHQRRYVIKELIPDYYSMVNNTIYIRDTREKVVGAVTAQQWMHDKYSSSQGCGLEFKIQNDCIVFSRLPSARYKLEFQYRSDNIVWDFHTYIEKNELTANTDVPIFDEYLVKLGILWRWLKRSGLSYDEEYEEYSRELKKKFGVEQAAGDINLAGGSGYEQGVTINAVKVNK